MSPAHPDNRVSAIRGFNRFYTAKIGVLQAAFLHTPFALTEARVLFEIGRNHHTTATQVAAELGLDAGYLSRMLARFQKQKLLNKKVSPDDGRSSLLSLTDRGKAAFRDLDERSSKEVADLIAGLTTEKQQRLVDAMRTIEEILRDPPQSSLPFVIRVARSEDFDWVVEKHGELYAAEYGWNNNLKEMTAQIVADFQASLKPAKERCWIAEWRGCPAGCIFLVQRSKTAAQLRLLLVAPEARGLGIGGRLVEECVDFARKANYREVTLWTHSVLTSARRIYEAQGFRLTKEERHRKFGPELIGQIWTLRFTKERPRVPITKAKADPHQ